MWLKVSIVLAMVCAYLIYDVTAYNARRQLNKGGPLQDRNAGPIGGPNAGPSGSYLGQGGAGSTFGSQGRGDDLKDNKGRSSNYLWPPNSRKSNQQPAFGTPEDSQNGPSGRGPALGRYRRDYGYGFNRGYWPGNGFYGSGFADGPGDFGGYGFDNWRRE